ncbi:MAG: cation diffusion facilitator family transporter [Candidatus Solibacter sp.]
MTAVMDIQEREKRSAALSSLWAAVGLTTMKTIVGLLTGSLGILAEAAHSALDLVAALMTYIAVRISGKPADRSHLYGHGKVENLSALVETLLLFVTCGWIIREAVHRLFFHKVDVEVTIWSFAVMATSIVVDISRSRMLARAAKLYHSQALEADALHFETDVWSSSVVILGLACVKLGEWIPSVAWLREADAVAALGVSVLVIWVCWQLGKRTVDALVDSAPEGMEERILAVVSAVPGVMDCHHVRARYSGPILFIDLHVLVDGNQTLFAAHALTETIEGAIQELAPQADVTVHPEPF